MLPVTVGKTPDQIPKSYFNPEPLSYLNTLPASDQTETAGLYQESSLQHQVNSPYGDVGGAHLVDPQKWYIWKSNEFKEKAGLPIQPITITGLGKDENGKTILTDPSIPDLPWNDREVAFREQDKVINNTRDKLTMKMLECCFVPGAEVNNRDNIYSGKPGIGYLLNKNRNYFLSNEMFLNTLTDLLHYRTLDTCISDLLSGGVTWGQDRRDKSSLLTGSMGVRAIRLLHKWQSNSDCPAKVGVAEDEVDLNILEENCNYGEYASGEGDGFLCGRAGYLRSLLFLLKDARYEKTRMRLYEIIKTVAEDIIESQASYARENPLITTLLYGDSNPHVVYPLRTRELRDTTNSMLIRSGDLGASMGSAGIFHTLLLALQELNRSSQFTGAVYVAPWQDLLLDAINCYETFENAWNNYPNNVMDEWGGGRFTTSTFNSGAPGAVYMFSLAYEIYQKDSFLLAAERAAETCWRECLVWAKLESFEPERLAGELSVSLVQYNREGGNGGRGNSIGNHNANNGNSSSDDEAVPAIRRNSFTGTNNNMIHNSTNQNQNIQNQNHTTSTHSLGHFSNTSTNMSANTNSKSAGGGQQERVTFHDPSSPRNSKGKLVSMASSPHGHSISLTTLGIYNNSSRVKPIPARESSRFNELGYYFKNQLRNRTGDGVPEFPKEWKDKMKEKGQSGGGGGGKKNNSTLQDLDGDDPNSDEDEKKDFRLYGIQYDSKARHSGRQVKTKGFLNNSPSTKGGNNTMGDGPPQSAQTQRLNSSTQCQNQSESSDLVIVKPDDRYGVIRNKYFNDVQTVHSKTRSWLSNNRLVKSPRCLRSCASRPILINPGQGAAAQKENYENAIAADGGLKALRRRCHKQEIKEYEEAYKRVIDTRLFSGSLGNGYAMLRMARLLSGPNEGAGAGGNGAGGKGNKNQGQNNQQNLKSEKWLFRARQLAHAICDKMDINIDELGAIDFHLGDGYAGLLSFLIDVTDPWGSESRFPLFE